VKPESQICSTITQEAHGRTLHPSAAWQDVKTNALIQPAMEEQCDAGTAGKPKMTARPAKHS